MDTRKKWALGALAVVVAVTAFALLGSRPSPVRTVTVTRGAIAQSLVATGRIEASARIDIGSEVTGTVREVRARRWPRPKPRCARRASARRSRAASPPR